MRTILLNLINPMQNISSNLCTICSRPIEPERLELGYLLCFRCADSLPEQGPRGLVHSTSPEGDFEVEVVSNNEFNKIKSYQPYIED
jgi:hypothetical protein